MDQLMKNPTQALAGALDELAGLISRIGPEEYSRTESEGFSSSIGAHVRHCLDHVDALIAGIAEGEIHYDRRVRGTQAETDRDYALTKIDELQSELPKMKTATLPSQIRVAALSSADGEEEIYSSSGPREVLYVFHHTVHHLALMAAQATCMGVPLDSRVGRAPATLAADHAN